MFWILQEHYHKRKDMKKGFSIVVGIIVLVMMILCLLAIYANDSWIEFSTLTNEIMTPILTIINVFVFVKLTTASSEIDKARLKKEIEYRERELVVEYRKKELEKFDKIMTETLLFGMKECNNEEALYSMMLYVESFYMSKLQLFGLSKESLVASEVKSYCDDLVMTYDRVKSGGDINKNDILELIKRKDSIVSSLLMDLLLI